MYQEQDATPHSSLALSFLYNVNSNLQVWNAAKGQIAINDCDIIISRFSTIGRGDVWPFVKII